jgi:hypothetical protein
MIVTIYLTEDQESRPHQTFLVFPIVYENRIVYDQFQSVEQLHRKSRALLRKKRSRVPSSSATPLIDELVTLPPSASLVMAKTLLDYSVPAIANVPIGPAINIGDRNFELYTSLIMLVQANQFSGLPSEDANAHLQHFLELYDTIIVKEVEPASIRLSLFPFSLLGRVK